MTKSFKLDNPIALFPLPDTVFFPETHLPLHIFEPRYRQMVEDALKHESLIGMVLLSPGWEANYYGRPEVVEMGCAGRIKSFEQLPDGKFNIILEGLSRFCVLEEFDDKPYRLAKVDFLNSTHDYPLTTEYAESARRLIFRYEELIELFLRGKENRLRPSLHNCKTVGQAIDQIAHSLDWNPQQKQSFLEELNVQNRLTVIKGEIDLKDQILRLSAKQKKNNSDFRLN